MPRMPVNRNRSRKVFNARSEKTHPKNIIRNTRGGTRL